MIARKRRITRQKPELGIERESIKQRLERKLERGLEDTFPASDAVAVTEPAPTAPDNGNEKIASRIRRRRS
jgi:hypothetical protein